MNTKADSPLRRVMDEISLSYAQIVFSRSRAVGLLLLLATAAAPRALFAGLLAIITASLTARLLDLDPEARREGAFGYNALLVGLGLAQTFSGATPLLLVLVAVPACTLLTAALRTLFASSGVPVLSWPFLLLFWMVLSAPAHSSGFLIPAAHLTAPSLVPLPLPIELFLRGLGALFFQPTPLAGALLLCALLWHSRIAALFSACGFALAWLLTARLSLPPGSLVAVLGYNAAFTAMALGGVWFVPSPSSFLLALFGVLLSVVGVIGVHAPLAKLGLPVMVLPFNAIVAILLLAMRTRASDRAPKAVDFLPGTPEENLSYFRTRLLRFRRLYAVSLQLPFRGAWLCTQGVDGSFTHKGRWRHAYDFEVRGGDGLLFHSDGSVVEHYHAWRLPVLATAAGTVVKVVDHVPDNALGAMNLDDNWGNLVLIYHAPGLYSMVAHLQRASIRVVPGQIVRQGEFLGLCGSSGRSPQPHLHFHLQPTDRIGEGTLPCRFNDLVVLRAAGAGTDGPTQTQVETSHGLTQGQEVRNLEPSAEGAVFLALPGGEWHFTDREARSAVVGDPATEGAAPQAVERVVSEVDLYGRRLLRSREHGAVLYYELGESFFTVYDVVGGPRSILHLLRAALPRVPFEPSESLRWRDHLPARPLRTFVARMLGDFVSPFLRYDGIEVELRLHREGPLLVVTGESVRHDRSGAPLLRTRVALGPEGAPQKIEVTLRGRRVAAERALIPIKS